MTSDTEGSKIAPEGKRGMSSDYGQRAALALDRLVPGPHRDKKISKIFDVSVRMAKYLRSGKGWTVERLNQASARWQAFDAYIASPDLFNDRLRELETEMDRLRDDWSRRTGG